MVVDAGSVPEPTPAKSLSERVVYANSQHARLSATLTKSSANPKAQPKSATATKATTKDAAKGRAGTRGKAARPNTRKTGRPKAKTTAELDAEMTDYFAGNGGTSAPTAEVTAATVNGGAEAAANTEDLGMDEISVHSLEFIT